MAVADPDVFRGVAMDFVPVELGELSYRERAAEHRRRYVRKHGRERGDGRVRRGVPVQHFLLMTHGTA